MTLVLCEPDAPLSITSVLDTIADYAHWRNWSSDWGILKKLYLEHPDSYSVLAPFAYSYLEELIRSTTSEYKMELLDDKGNPKRYKVSMRLMELAKAENADNEELLSCLSKVESRFSISSPDDRGENRNSTMHGYMHSNYWSRESFEDLLHDIASLSPYAGF